MMRLQIRQRGWFRGLLLAGALFIVTILLLIDPPSASAAAKKSKQSITAAEATARRYAEAMGAGNAVAVGQLDFPL
jgi:Flp pilus assembly protein protease CpaA